MHATNEAPAGYRPAIVAIDDGVMLPAFLPTSGQRWNGWEMPIFDPAVIAQHRETLAKMFPVEGDNPDALVLSWNGDRPSIIDPQFEDDEEFDYVAERVVDGRAFLDIGGGAFVWSEMEEMDLAEAVVLVHEDVLESFDDMSPAESVAHARNILILPGEPYVLGGSHLEGDESDELFRAYVAVLRADEDALAAAVTEAEGATR